MTATEKFVVKNRWTNRPQFEATIECASDASIRVKLGLAVRWAVREKADLSGADLSGADLRGAVLRGAVLRGADLSGAVLRGAVLRGAALRCADLRCAVLSGADLRDAVLSGAVLSGADLRGAVLRGAVLSGAVLRCADLRCAVLSGADLRDAVLSGAVLRDADLRGAVLRGAVLSGAVLRDADLRGAVLRGADLSDFPIKIPNIHQRVYEAASAPDALNMDTWHSCGTTHCRAGWVTTLAGEGAKALEWAMGTSAAASLIYIASDPTLEKVPDFYCGNEEALADMKRLAEDEAARAEVA